MTSKRRQVLRDIRRVAMDDLHAVPIDAPVGDVSTFPCKETALLTSLEQGNAETLHNGASGLSWSAGSWSGGWRPVVGR